ncbi:MAG TPA: pitrilysin family protein [Thermoanaerobaculia bacterium]|nr:pitrilysin family protein [Thermoanaerobaculia bacterium]
MSRRPQSRWREPATAPAENVESALSAGFSLPGRIRRQRLANGLEVCLIENPQAPVVTSALYYRAGTRDEKPGHGGTAHFLEHMMFKGSALYGPGEIDRRTQALGGSNNAFTSHDATAYHFNFAADRWTEALAIEADRMTALTLDPDEVASERQVILEEIAMYASEPWDALEIEVQGALFGAHAYGRPVLGTKEELLATGAEELADFHRRFYRPDNAVLVVAGEVGESALAEIDKTLGAIAAPPPRPAPREPIPPRTFPRGLTRLARRKGEVPRLFLALPAPPADHPDHPALRLLVTLLAAGRASRLHRSLVDEGQLCVFVHADLSESLDASFITVAAEVVPGVATERIEAEILRHLADLAARVPDAEEIERTKQIARADWVFGHEKLHQQALSAGFALTLFDLGYLERHLSALLATSPERLSEVAARYLVPERGAVLGWSLPREGA